MAQRNFGGIFVCIIAIVLVKVTFSLQIGQTQLGFSSVILKEHTKVNILDNDMHMFSRTSAGSPCSNVHSSFFSHLPSLEWMISTSLFPFQTFTYLKRGHT